MLPVPEVLRRRSSQGWSIRESGSGGPQRAIEIGERLRSRQPRRKLSFRRYTVLVRDRFTRRSKTERGRIRPRVKNHVLRRDDYTCQYCGQRFEADELT